LVALSFPIFFLHVVVITFREVAFAC